MIKGLCRDHRTAALMISHDIGVIAETAHRVAVMYAGQIVEIGSVENVVKEPKHPYTQGLMASIPRLEDDVERLNQIEGVMPTLAEKPGGCAFHPRCSKVIARCLHARPELLSAGATEAACWLVAKND